jgi:hypothetical protein
MATMEEYARLLELGSLNPSHISQFEKTMKFRMGEIQLQSEVVKMCEVDFVGEVGMQSTLLDLLKEEYRRLHIKFARTPRELEN